MIAVSTGATVRGAAQQVTVLKPTQDAYQAKRREIHPKPIETPFPLNVRTGRQQELEFRAPGQMTAADRELAEGGQMEIARRAELQGFRGVGGTGQIEMEPSKDGGWGYEQAVCPAFPEHLILEYSRGENDGDVTLFAAVIPRGEGHVRVIPVRRRGYSLWTPSSSNALTINDFNHMVKEGETGLSPDFHPNGVDLPLGTPDWLTLGLCYAALAGGHVRAALVPKTAADEAYPLKTPAMLRVGGKKDETEVRFADTTPGVKSMQWVMTLDSKGRLLKVKHVDSPEVHQRATDGAPIEVATKAAGNAH